MLSDMLHVETYAIAALWNKWKEVRPSPLIPNNIELTLATKVMLLFEADRFLMLFGLRRPRGNTAYVPVCIWPRRNPIVVRVVNTENMDGKERDFMTRVRPTDHFHLFARSLYN